MAASGAAPPRPRRDLGWRGERYMTAVANPHNLPGPVVQGPKPYGIRVSLRPGDPFSKIIGPDWNRTHWYASADERDAALREMSRQHEYSRVGDRPALQFAKVEDLAASRGL